MRSLNPKKFVDVQVLAAAVWLGPIQGLPHRRRTGMHDLKRYLQTRLLLEGRAEHLMPLDQVGECGLQATVIERPFDHNSNLAMAAEVFLAQRPQPLLL